MTMTTEATRPTPRQDNWRLHMIDLLEWCIKESKIARLWCSEAPPPSEWAGDDTLRCQVSDGSSLHLSTEFRGTPSSPIIATLRHTSKGERAMIEIKIPRSVVDPSMRKHGFKVYGDK